MENAVDLWSLLAAGSKFVIYVASFLAVGTLLFRIALPRAGDEVADALRPLAIGAAVVAILATLFRVMVQAGRLMDEWAGMVDPQIIAISLEGPLGQSTYVRLGGLALIVVAALFRPVRAPATLFGAIMVASSFAVTGHATRDPQWLLGGLITFHLLAVAYWFGALAPLHRLTRFEDGAAHAAAIADRFGKQASIIVPMLILAGAGFAYALLGGIEPFWTTAYGRMLLAKIGIVAVVLGIAALNKWRFVPALAADGDRAGPAFRRSLRLEAVVFLLVFAATAFLTTSFTVPEAG
ncbi:MAG: CopD family protein [Roseitalea porphyridii]|uniref:CopD family protein n=1 Tax=Roseitalea porphyridii TaxID=1852022 RepID=UPI0032ED61DE